MDALIEFTGFFREGWDKKLVGQLSFVDLKKAFDNMNHDVSLAKMEKYGYRGRIHCLLLICLTKKQISYRRTMSCGVPQWSISGPFSFLVYLNDLSKIAIGSEGILLADDTTLCKAEKN